MTEGTPPPPDQPQTPEEPQSPGQQPPPYGQPFGQPPQPGGAPSGQPTPPPAYSAPPPSAQPDYGQQPGYGQQPATRDPNRRPGTVLAATILTWVFSGIAAIGAAVLMIGISADRESFVDEMERDEDIDDLGWSGDEIADAFTAINSVVLVLALIAVVVGVFAFRRSSGGRMALVVLSSITALLSLAGSIFCLPALWLVASVVTIVLLFTGGANDWYARRGAAQAPTYNQPGDYGQWPQA